MRDKRAIFDFGSSHFTVYYDGKVKFRAPCAVIIKRTLQPTVVAYGEDAVARAGDVTEEEMFWQPVKKGTVAHLECCVELVKYCMTEAFGRLSRPPVCVLVSCGLNVEQRSMIEKVFVSAGYPDVFLMESLLGLALPAKKRGLACGVIIGAETTEVGIFSDNKLVSGYSLDIGSKTVDEKIKTYVAETHKLILSDKGAEDVKKNAASLYPNDYTRVRVSGKDPITGRTKNITLVGTELHSVTTYVYGRILKVLEAALSAAPIDILSMIADTGLLFAGFGSRQEGLCDYVEQNLRLKAYLCEEGEYLPWSGAEVLAKDEAFVKTYLTVVEPNRPKRKKRS